MTKNSISCIFRDYLISVAKAILFIPLVHAVVLAYRNAFLIPSVDPLAWLGGALFFVIFSMAAASAISMLAIAAGDPGYWFLARLRRGPQNFLSLANIFGHYGWLGCVLAYRKIFPKIEKEGADAAYYANAKEKIDDTLVGVIEKNWIKKVNHTGERLDPSQWILIITDECAWKLIKARVEPPAWWDLDSMRIYEMDGINGFLVLLAIPRLHEGKTVGEDYLTKIKIAVPTFADCSLRQHQETGLQYVSFLWTEEDAAEEAEMVDSLVPNYLVDARVFAATQEGVRVLQVRTALAVTTCIMAIVALCYLKNVCDAWLLPETSFNTILGCLGVLTMASFFKLSR